MKKLLLTSALLVALSLTFSSCRDTKKADTVEESIENANDAMDDAAAEQDEMEQENMDTTVDTVDVSIDAANDAIDAAAAAEKKAE